MYQNLSFCASKIQPSDGPTIKISYGQQDSATPKIPIMLLNIGGELGKLNMCPVRSLPVT